jgi:EF-P beta-lysylation protein EpmB
MTLPVPAWQHELQCAVTDPDELLTSLGLDPALGAPARAAASAFGMRVTRSYLSRMRRGDANDPLLRQVLPLATELLETPGYGADPLLEHDATRAPGLLQKYQGRALLITTQACAIHCRYCFRREFPYSAQQDSAAQGATRFRAALDVIAGDSSIEEVILSGGDPLSLSDARLTKITDALARIRHVQRIRVHTRQPIVLPSRVDDGLLAWLRSIRLPTVFVLHTNHPNELDRDVRDACAKLRSAGVTLLNQSAPRGDPEHPAVRLPRAAAGPRSPGRALQGAERRLAPESGAAEHPDACPYVIQCIWKDWRTGHNPFPHPFQGITGSPRPMNSRQRMTEWMNP